MKTTCIDLLEKFGVCTVLLPYYGTIDRSFLLLSQLNCNSRVMLDEYFEEILNCMIWNITLLKIDEECQEKCLLLPSNLFKFEIILNCEELVNTFLSTIQCINDNKGYYFNEHYMHSRLYIELLRVKDNFVSKLSPHIDLLKTTEIINCSIIEDNRLLLSRSSLLDKFSLFNNYSYESYQKRIVFPHIIDNELEGVRFNPIFKAFRKVYYINCRYYEVYQTIEALIDIRDFGLKIETISLSAESPEESETITNPEYFKNGIDHIIFSLIDISALSDNFISNINTIKPHKFTLIQKYKTHEKLDYLMLLKEIKSCPNIEFTKSMPIGLCKLTFNKVPIFVKQDERNFVLIKCRSFVCYLNINEIYEKFRFITAESTSTSECSLLHITDSNSFEFHDFEWERDKQVVNQLQKESSINTLTENIDKGEFIIPMCYLDTIHIDESQASDLVLNDQGIYFINEIRKAKKFLCSIKITNLLKSSYQYTSLFPSKCIYSLNRNVCFQKFIGKPLNKNFVLLVKNLSKMNVSSINYDQIMTFDELQLMRELFSTSNFKTNLRDVKLKINDLSDALKFLSLLSECLNLEKVELRYSNICCLDTMDKQIDIIRQAKSEFYKKVGIIQKLKIYHK